MRINTIDTNNLIKLFCFVIFLFGIYLCFIGGYGSDEDTLPMIYVFERRLSDGAFVTSRFTGNPVAEIGIGFLAYFFGSFFTNLTTFVFFVFGCIFIYLALSKNKNDIFLFILLCLSSQILFFDNLEPIDYSWALFPFSIGLFLFSKKQLEWSILFFAISVGARINFLFFVIVAIFFFETDDKISIFKKISLILITFFISGLFYLPIWYEYSFGLSWITAARPTEQGIFGLFSRFSYKTLFAFGIIQSFIIFFVLVKSRTNLINFYKNRIIFIIILINLSLFFYIPAELSYLQPAIIFTYFFVIKYFKKNIIYTLIILNFISWIINFDFLKINYKNDDLCSPKEAISAELSFKIKPGAIKNYYQTRELIKCWAYDTHEERTKKILSGKSLKD